jgi:hypothetical protein
MGGQPINGLFETMTLLKVGIAIFMVLFLSVLAEMVSPRFAGLFSGYPLGAAINLFFIGIEVSPEFAAESALYTAVGLIATQVFAYAYFRTSSGTISLSGIPEVAVASLGGLGAYFLSASLLRFLPIDLATAVLVPTVSILLFNSLFKGLKDVRIERRVSLKARVVLFRCVFAAFAILTITSTAGMVGPRWAGLFSAFPITMLPFVAIIHLTYGAEYAHAVLKNVPRGLTSLVVYSVAVSVSYRSCGVFVGTALAYGLATICLVVMQFKATRPARSPTRSGQEDP